MKLVRVENNTFREVKTKSDFPLGYLLVDDDLAEPDPVVVPGGKYPIGFIDKKIRDLPNGMALYSVQVAGRNAMPIQVEMPPVPKPLTRWSRILRAARRLW